MAWHQVHHRALNINLLWIARVGRILMSGVPLYTVEGWRVRLTASLWHHHARVLEGVDSFKPGSGAGFHF
jgi:hypothetical protein